MEKNETRQSRIQRKDLLNRENTAETIAEEIESNFGKHNDGYIFAISGKWGEGKTDLLERLEPKLVSLGFNVVWFKPWQFTQDAETLRRVFLKTLKTQLSKLNLPIDYDDWKSALSTRRVDLKRLDLEETKTTINFDLIKRAFDPIKRGVVILIIIGVAVFYVLQLMIVQEFLGGINDFISKNSIPSSIVVVVTTILLAPQIFQVQHRSSKISSTDEFEELFERILKPHTKVVIFVDDLDRCTPEGVRLVLDTLKTFFKTKRASFVVSGDHTVLERYLGEELKVTPVYKADGTGIDQEATEVARGLEGRRFLQKLFNVYWKLPQLDPSEARGIASAGIKPINIDSKDKDKILDLIAFFLTRNLREITRFLEILSFSLKQSKNRIKQLEGIKRTPTDEIILKNLKEVYNNPDLLAKILIIQENFDGEFYIFSKNPTKYAQLEQELLKGPSGPETIASKGRLKETRFNNFSSLIKNSPTFYNPTKQFMEHPTDVFFYYSGFTGTGETGLLSEGFLSRYITEDQSLIEDLKQSEGQIKELAKAGINNLNELSDQTQLNLAINNLILMLETKELNIHELLADLLNHGKVIEQYKTFDDPKKDAFLSRVFQVAIGHELVDPIRKLLSEEPWKERKHILRDKIDVIRAPENILSLFLDDLEKDRKTGVEVSPHINQIIEKHIEVLQSPKDFSNEDIDKTVDRLNGILTPLNPKDFVNNELFNEIFEEAQSKDNKLDKRKRLLGILLKTNPMWGGINKPSAELRFMRKRSTLRRLLGDITEKVFESWN
ncbi:hypothetical protein IID23_04060 [Patescibacteria group bacterium]|nr:hypothetical protein [Patescibacteria group bacterium]